MPNAGMWLKFNLTFALRLIVLFNYFTDLSGQWLIAGSSGGFVVIWAGRTRGHFQPAFMTTSEPVTKPFTDSQEATMMPNN